MEIKNAIASMAPNAGSSTVNISVEFGDEEITFSVIVPNQPSDESSCDGVS